MGWAIRAWDKVVGYLGAKPNPEDCPEGTVMDPVSGREWCRSALVLTQEGDLVTPEEAQRRREAAAAGQLRGTAVAGIAPQQPFTPAEANRPIDFESVQPFDVAAGSGIVAPSAGFPDRPVTNLRPTDLVGTAPGARRDREKQLKTNVAVIGAAALLAYLVLRR